MSQCVDCTYYNSDDGTCHRSPPSNRTLPGETPGTLQYITVWVAVSWDDWCGEFIQKEE